MNSSQIVCLVAIALILALAFYKCPSKENFRMAPPHSLASNGVIEVSNVPLGIDHSPNIFALNEGNFRGGSGFKDLVQSPSLPVQKQDQVLGQYLTPQDMMPNSNMEQGSRHNADGSIPNEGNVIAVNLAKTRHTDCMMVFNIGADEGVQGPVNDVWRHTDDHHKNYSLITGTDYDPNKFNKQQGRLELVHV